VEQIFVASILQTKGDWQADDAEGCAEEEDGVAHIVEVKILDAERSISILLRVQSTMKRMTKTAQWRLW
jgi:hypothetical protein